MDIDRENGDMTIEELRTIKVDYGFDDPRSGVDADKYLAQKKKKYGII